MFKQFKDKVAFSGISVLLIGVALLIFTFVSAYAFLTQSLSIIASADLVSTFGEALAPLITACIRMMYLGIMGWVGSLLTIRGITIIAHLPETAAATPGKPEAKEQQQPEERKVEKPVTEPAKPEAKPSEPQIIVIPPDVTQKAQSQPGQPEKSEPQPAS